MGIQNSGALCPHLITHIDPAIESLLREKCGIEFSSINQWTLESFQEFGQLGIQAQWLIDNIELIEKIFGQVITSQVVWNKAVDHLTKLGFGAIEGFDKQAVDAAIAFKRRASKLLEGQDRLANADVLHSQLRSDNNEKDRIRIGTLLAKSFASLEQAKKSAMNEPAIQEAVAVFNESVGQNAKRAKLALQYGNDAPSHPLWNGSNNFSGSGEYSGSFGSFSGSEYRQLGGGGSPMGFIKSAKEMVGNIANGFRKIGQFFGGGGSFAN
ncbi:MAG: hypothetical protein [Phormidium phage MIS-PhV1A]|uniref:hypothetical protein n=1 Tax=Phormidium phage MIS-PhV1A TaxID=1391455 RepID=UPI0003C98A38|nr:MAG: hypothetical protein AV945_gp52 [Phormidium phage MIS-PhV1A]AGZ61797.1 MAG: hypothetical protein [Phormidium phage MIS-PhV1A]